MKLSDVETQHIVIVSPKKAALRLTYLLSDQILFAVSTQFFISILHLETKKRRFVNSKQ